MKVSAGYVLLLALLILPAAASAADGTSIPVVLGHSTVALNGPWKFDTGDDPRWADPAFDDSAWEGMDLSAPPGANDGDVGISPYGSGWSAKGHPGYQGYAWYRLRVMVTPPQGESLALLGPWAVDSVYQVYVNGTLLGGVGEFSADTPVAYGNHYPRLFPLPPAGAGGGTLVLAIRVWAGPWVGGTAGIHVAPIIGGREAIIAQYRLQWLTIIEGYAVDVVPALLFFLMSALSVCLLPFSRADRTGFWFAAALMLSGIQRGNQAFFFWWEIETIRGFVYFIIAFIGSLSLGAWMMAWRSWFRLDNPGWLPKAVAVLTLALMLAQVLGQPWVFGAVFPHPVSTGVRYLITCLRLAFLLVFISTACYGVRQRGREAWYALPAMLAIGMVLFSRELSALHVPGIWFPYGIGISLSEIMSVVFDVLLFALLVRRIRFHPTLPPSLWSSEHESLRPAVIGRRPALYRVCGRASRRAGLRRPAGAQPEAG